MGHGGGEEGGESSERWLVSYADFITLLMVLFVVLYSMGKVDIEKYKRLAESMRTAFTLGGAVKVVDTQINSTGGTIENGKANPIVVPGIPEGPPKSEEVAGQLTQMLSSSHLGSEVSVQTNIEGVLISLSEKLVFQPGKSELPPEAKPVLDMIAKMVLPISNPVRLVGHTDNTPPTDPRYKNNWELSVARAMGVANYLINAGVDPSRITVSGRGEYEPVFPNDTPEHRSLNGRVDIIIIYQVASSVIGDTQAQPTP
jgi:chemotaxis protein MotB